MRKFLGSIAYGSLFGLVVSSGVIPSVAHAQVNLPTANCGVGSTANNCLVFDQFTVYSLGLLSDYQKNLGLYGGFDFTYKPNEALVTIIDGAGQGTPIQGAGTAID